MWMVNRKLQGIDPPGALTADMFPPSMRSVDQSNAVQVVSFLLILFGLIKYKDFKCINFGLRMVGSL